jgi:hypothetical protein
MSKKFLYGAAVQGIQSFIFQTKELREIIGASEMVEQICTKCFDEYVQTGEVLLQAAGNIKCEYSNQKECEKTVLEFPRKVMTYAPGITISQAVEVYEKDEDYPMAAQQLEQKLRQQRNRPMRSQTLGMLGCWRAAASGMPIVSIENGNRLDAATKQKTIHCEEKALCKKAFGMAVPADKFPYNLKDITSHNDWIAIIHIDGNGLGKVVQKKGKNKRDFANFSKNLNEATCTAAQATFMCLNEEYNLDKLSKLPIRPVVLGGDDLTIICRGDLAIDYTKTFIQFFEKKTEQLVGTKLTACGGIAYIKSSYPFYYGYELAEQLCKYAKEQAREINADLTPSCLMFHKVQDSYINDYENDIIPRELLVGTEDAPTLSWAFGPYFTEHQDKFWTINKLQEIAAELDGNEQVDNNAIKSHVRQWMTLMHDNPGLSVQHTERMTDIFGTKKQLLESVLGSVKRPNTNIPVCPAYDIMTYLTIKNQTTK